MRERHARLRRHECARGRRVRIAIYEDCVGLGFGHQWLESDHRSCRLLGVAAGADPEHVLRGRQLELFEEDLRQVAVVVLAGVHEDLLANGA